MSNPNKLEARIQARNRVHQEILERAPMMIEALRPFVGKKVRNVTGCLSDKVTKALPESVNQSGLVCVMFYYETTRYCIRVCMKVSQGWVDHHGCVYAEASHTLADLDEQTGDLKNVREFPLPEYFRTDYTAAEILEKRAAYDKAKEAANHAEYALAFFGRYDQ